VEALEGTDNIKNTDADDGVNFFLFKEEYVTALIGLRKGPG
jgi:hypothetical protein